MVWQVFGETGVSMGYLLRSNGNIDTYCSHLEPSHMNMSIRSGSSL
ncbi:hypothetical protein [Vibrio ulleungensis]|uniref:Uncharacterized protein n=1 Tax=Vibrio ulleungensis TaxID=2807619 RepID=A0ABS2HIP2_9VIBR|nr:hypothetical protein [Vibrio ulleungensis]MBM7036516.1 hypothetical protein [Vibrio ulleungensis]